MAEARMRLIANAPTFLDHGVWSAARGASTREGVMRIATQAAGRDIPVPRMS